MTESRGLRDDEAKDRRYHPTYSDSTKLFHVLNWIEYYRSKVTSPVSSLRSPEFLMIDA